MEYTGYTYCCSCTAAYEGQTGKTFHAIYKEHQNQQESKSFQHSADKNHSLTEHIKNITYL